MSCWRNTLFVELFRFTVKNDADDCKGVASHPCKRYRVPKYQNWDDNCHCSFGIPKHLEKHNTKTKTKKDEIIITHDIMIYMWWKYQGDREITLHEKMPSTRLTWLKSFVYGSATMFRYSDGHSKNLPQCMFVEPSIQRLDLRDHDVWLRTYEKHNKIGA